jgi:tRNA nucleotidyltransferase (CCA-adding enzyme)
MNLILTHENADFDAIAAQLAAHRLVPDATPVLPRNLHRNVRHFVRLYWDELPFIHAKDLPRDPVERVLVVDTQHVQTMRGMSDQTAVQIIDHHARRDSLDPAWQVTIDELGATTTILCERLRAGGATLTPVEATLLALGIYEDTGSLTYSATTARDVYAAAWLLERGALLDVINEFLHHPLAEEQIDLYERLLENAQSHDVEGHPVVIATGSAPDLVEEVASLAHKIRDLLEPAAIFLLVDLGSHIQLVARSAVDAIDVGEVAERFGGGGHACAAAGIIRDMTLTQAHNALLEVLPRLARPGLTVADLMSHGVQTFPPDTRADEAAAVIRRYGYEGYPIVEEGRIIGLLTRRAVDRAIDHGLIGVRVDRLMEAGSVSVRPTDSVATLQNVMMTTGWGQVPVVDEAGEIDGVVTRTDLIQHMGHTRPAISRRAEITRRLEAALPPALMALVRETGRIAGEMNLNLYVVGGFVRDLLLDLPTTDMDFVVEGDAIALTRALRDEFGGDMRSHARFGTGKWMLTPAIWQEIAARLDAPANDLARCPPHIDFVTARTEFYHAPTALPEVERSSIKLDLHRRDFTINTLAIRLDPYNFGQLLDFYGGDADLREKRIRVLHSISFIDDPTRILRAVRLEQRLGFTIEPRTGELIGHALPLLDRVSGDRIRHEIELILEEPAPEHALSRLDDLGVLRAIHPDFPHCDDWLFAAFRALRHAVDRPLWPELGANLVGGHFVGNHFDLVLPYFHLLTYRLDPDALWAICRRIRVRRRTITDLEQVQRLRARMDDLSRSLRPSQVYAILSGTNDRVLASLWAAAPMAVARDQIADYARRLRQVSPIADGEALKARGLKPGPRFGTILEALRAAWLDGKVTGAEEEAALLDRLIAEEAPPHTG